MPPNVNNAVLFSSVWGRIFLLTPGNRFLVERAKKSTYNVVDQTALHGLHFITNAVFC